MISRNDKAVLRDEQAREFDSLNNRLFLFQIMAVSGLLALYFFSGASASLAEGLTRRYGENRWYLTNAVYSLVTVFGFIACMFPVSYYGDYVLEHHYELTDETFGEWLFCFFKSLLLDLALATLLFSVIYALLRWSSDWWWLFAAIFYILVSLVLSVLVPLVILPLFYTFEPLEEGELSAAVDNLVAGAGIQMRGVFKWETDENAGTPSVIFTGIGKAKRIVLSDALLSGYSREEILAILAHEIGHYKHHDVLRLSLVNSLLAMLGFYISHLCLSYLSVLFGFAHIYNVGAAPLFVFCLFIFSLVSMPFANMHSRRLEFAADAYAAEVMGDTNVIVSAYKKLAEENLSNKEPHPWIEFLLHSHPSLKRRIIRLRASMID